MEHEEIRNLNVRETEDANFLLEQSINYLLSLSSISASFTPSNLYFTLHPQSTIVSSIHVTLAPSFRAVVSQIQKPRNCTRDKETQDRGKVGYFHFKS